MAIDNPYGQGGSKYGERGAQDAKYWAYQAFIDQMGRAPTEQELAQAVPAFIGSDPNRANISGGNAFVSNFINSLKADDPVTQQKNAETASQGAATNVSEQYKNLMPEIQQGYLDPLDTAIQQQRGVQNDQTNQSLGQVQDLTQQNGTQLQDLLNRFLSQQQGFNQQSQQDQQGLNQGAVGQQQGFNQDYINQLMGINSTQNDLLGQRMQSQRDQLMNQLTNGPEGEAFRQKYNSLGLLNSGAFNTGLSNQFGNLAYQQQQDILNQGINQQNQLASATGQGASALSSLGSQGLGLSSGINSQGLGSLSSLGSQGLADQTSNQNQGLAASLGLLGQNFQNQTNLGVGGLAAQQEALQTPINQGITQFNNQQTNGLGLQNALMNRTFNVDDFNQQSILGQLLAEQAKPSALQSAMGLASSGGQAAGGIGQGYSATKSYICREMIKRGLLCESDFEDFYVHLFPAIIRKGRAFWNYYLYGQELVEIANRVYPSWASDMKPLFFDRVMNEKDPIKAVDLYSKALRKLCLLVAPHLWDDRNMRTNLVDSWLFLPRLLFCRPYRDNFFHLIRIKMAWLYDKHVCTLHREKVL